MLVLVINQDEDFVEQLASQMDALRGRELPGFMSAQSFYMFMAQYVEAWRDPARVAATEVRGARQSWLYLGWVWRLT